MCGAYGKVYRVCDEQKVQGSIRIDKPVQSNFHNVDVKGRKYTHKDHADWGNAILQ